MRKDWYRVEATSSLYMVRPCEGASRLDLRPTGRVHRDAQLIQKDGHEAPQCVRSLMTSILPTPCYKN